MIQHLSCIMDGNRRWAKLRNLLPWNGHREGVHIVRVAILFCLEQKIPHLSLYTFSLENFHRDKKEQERIFNCIIQALNDYLVFFNQHGIRVRFIGDRDLFPSILLPLCEKVEKETEHNSTLTVYFLLCYGGQQELVAGIQKIVDSCSKNSNEKITTETVQKYLWSAGMPAPDIIVRTGGAKRLSNFLLYQSAYSELFFLDCLWPELRAEHLHYVVNEFKKIKRNFGT